MHQVGLGIGLDMTGDAPSFVLVLKVEDRKKVQYNHPSIVRLLSYLFYRSLFITEVIDIWLQQIDADANSTVRRFFSGFLTSLTANDLGVLMKSLSIPQYV